MARSGLILVKQPKMLLPQELISKAVAAYPNLLSFASPNGEEIEYKFFDPLEVPEGKGNVEVDLEDAAMQVQEQLKDQWVFFHLSKIDDLDKEFSFESIQPFNIITEGNKDSPKSLLSVMLEGDFSEYEDGGTHTPEYNFVTDYLSEKITSIYHNTGGDLTKTIAALDTKIVKKDLLPYMKPRAVIAVISATGANMGFIENSEGKTYSFGGSTRDLDYIEPKPEPVKEPEPEKVVEPPPVDVPKRQLSLRERKALEASQAAAASAAAGVVQKAEPKVEEKPAPVTATLAIKNPTGAGSVLVDKKAKSRVDLSSQPYFYWNDNIHEWYCKLPIEEARARGGFAGYKKFWNQHCALNRPKGHPDSEKQVMAGFPAERLKQGSSLYDVYHGKQTAMRDAMQHAAVKDNKPLAAAAAVDDKKPVPKEEPLLVIPAEDKVKTAELFRTGIPRWTVEQIVNSTKEFEKYSEQIGVPIGTILQWPPMYHFKLSKKELTCLVNELRLLLIKVAPQILSTAGLEKKEEVKEETPTPTRQLSLRERKAQAA